MTSIFGEHHDLMESVYGSLKRAGCLKEFRHAMMVRAEEEARHLVGTDDETLMKMKRGEMRICFELADGALSALRAEEGKAKLEPAAGMPEVRP